MKRHTRFLV